MTKQIKMQLKKIARTMSEWPMIGRFVRVGVVVFRLSGITAFQTQQLPALLQTLSDINNRQLTNERDIDNLNKSIPITLRKITRDLIEMQGQLEKTSNSMEQRISETQDQLEKTSNSVGYLLGRVEFVRRELMFEMRYGATKPLEKGDQLKVKNEILSPEKLAAFRSKRLRLNLGCGNIVLDGYLNVDRRALPGVDIVAEVDDLPFGPGEVDEIFSAHLLEHFPKEQLRREILPYFYNLLKVGGKFQAIVPDGQEMTKRAAALPDYFESFRLVTFGGQDYDGDFHFNMFSPESLSKLLEEAGFKNIAVIERARKNDICYEFELSASK